MLKFITKKIHQWHCDHSVVRFKDGARHKANWSQKHNVTCTLCSKTWRMDGYKIFFTYTKEKECHCKWGKG